MATIPQFSPRLTEITNAQIFSLYATRNLGEVRSVTTPSSQQGEYHRVFRVDTVEHGRTYLRVARPCIPGKTEVEVATMVYVAAKRPGIKLPKVLAWDGSDANEIGHEFTIMTALDGDLLADVWNEQSAERKKAILESLADDLLQLSTAPVPSPGGIGSIRFSRDEDGAIIYDPEQIHLGPLVEDNFWELGDLRFWEGTGESYDSLNCAGPFADYHSFLSARFRNYSRLMRVHPSMFFMSDGDLVKRIDNLGRALAESKDSRVRLGVDNVKIVCSHNDVHFGNVLINEADVSGTIDWEFASTIAAHRNPPRNFLHPGTRHPNASEVATDNRLEFEAIVRRWADEGREDARVFLAESLDKDAIERRTLLEDLRGFVRAIVEVCPRDNETKILLAKGPWRNSIVNILGQLGF